MIRGTGIDSTVKLYLKGNGANGSTKFYDDSQNHRTITPSGGAKISTTQSKFGGSSMFFDGTGDYLTIDDPINLGANNFSIGYWQYLTAYPPDPPGRMGILSNILGNDSPRTGYNVSIGNVSGLNTYSFRYYTSGGVNVEDNFLYDSALPSLNTWHYILFTKEGTGATDFKMYIDGVSQANSYTGNFTISDSANDLMVGVEFTEPLYPYTGYLQDLTIQIGSYVPNPTQVPTRQRG